MKIIFAGSGEFGLPTLRAIHERGDEIVQVYTQPDRPAGRGKKLTPTAIAQAAETIGLAVNRAADLNASPLPPADLMVVIAFGQKISDAAANHPRLGSVNLHASLLPRYRGAAPINWAIINGETITGNSVIRLASRMDGGAILAQSKIAIGSTETAGELHDRLALDGAILVPRVLEELAAGSATERAQDESAATTAPKLSREMASLDWSRPADEVARRINGLSPWPGCRMRVVDGTLGSEIAIVSLVRAKAVAGEKGKAGEILDSGVVTAGVGAVEILEIGPEGRRKMPLADFRRGHRWGAGVRLESIA